MVQGDGIVITIIFERYALAASLIYLKNKGSDREKIIEGKKEDMQMEEMNNSGVEKEFDLRVFWGIIRKNIILIIVASLVFAGVFFAYSKFFITKQYEANAVLIVNNMNATDGKNYATTAELSAAQTLADVSAILIKEEPVLEPVIKNLGLNTTVDSLSKKISVSSLNSTQVIKITMRDSDATRAKNVVAEITKVAPPIIKDTVKAGSVEVVRDSKISNNGAPVSPNSMRNGIIGGLVGFVLIIVFVFVRELTNNTFKTEDDVLNSLNIPLLGIIPFVDAKEFNKSV